MKSKYIILIIACFLFCCNRNVNSINAQTNEANTISFSKNDIAKTTSTQPSFSNSFTLNGDEFLNIHFKLDKPLIESLQLIAPTLTEEELLEKGNFQFTFLVDGEIFT